MTCEEAQARFESLLKERFGVEEIPEKTYPLVSSEHHLELARVLREEFSYGIYGFVVASHYVEKVKGEEGAESTEREYFEVATGVRSAGPGSHLAIWRVQLESGEELPSLYALYAGADWQEREQYDLVGVRFSDHPDLRRLMLPEDWDGHPLRKEYAIETACSPWR